MTSELRPCPKPSAREKTKPAGLKRTRMKAVNPERKARVRAKQYPATRPLDGWCLVARELARYQREHGEKQWPAGWTRCWGGLEQAHVIRARGMGGVNSSPDQIVDLCHGHHLEQEGRSAAFEARYGVDLRKEAKLRASKRPEEGIPW